LGAHRLALALLSPFGSFRLASPRPVPIVARLSYKEARGNQPRHRLVIVSPRLIFLGRRGKGIAERRRGETMAERRGHGRREAWRHGEAMAEGRTGGLAMAEGRGGEALPGKGHTDIDRGRTGGSAMAEERGGEALPGDGHADIDLDNIAAATLVQVQLDRRQVVHR
jgi:hypothetical protein